MLDTPQGRRYSRSMFAKALKLLVNLAISRAFLRFEPLPVAPGKSIRSRGNAQSINGRNGHDPFANRAKRDSLADVPAKADIHAVYRILQGGRGSRRVDL